MNTAELDPNYTEIKLDALLTYGNGIGLDIFILLGKNKLVKVCHKEDPSRVVLEKYQQKGISVVYLLEKAYKDFVANVKKELSSKITAPPSPVLVGDLSNARSVLKTLFEQENISEDALDIADDIVKGTVSTVKKLNIFQMLAQFKANCSREYAHALMSSYLSSLIVDQFPWGNDEIKQKITMAAILADLTLTKDDFELIDNTTHKEELPKHIIEHPLVIAQKLEHEEKRIPKETLDIIREHHERPNGRGFPRGLAHQRISQLTAIYIVANWFVERLFCEKFEGSMPKENMQAIMVQLEERFHSGHFRKVTDVLNTLYASNLLF